MVVGYISLSSQCGSISPDICPSPAFKSSPVATGARHMTSSPIHGFRGDVQPVPPARRCGRLSNPLEPARCEVPLCGGAWRALPAESATLSEKRGNSNLAAGVTSPSNRIDKCRIVNVLTRCLTAEGASANTLPLLKPYT